MKKVILILSLFVCLQHVAKADTTDYWHIYFNDDRIKMCDATHPAELLFNASKIQATDSITVKPSTDAPCYACKTMLFVENTEGSLLATAVGQGTFNPITFSLKDVANSGAAGKEYRVFFSQESPNSKEKALKKVFLFSVRIR